MSHAFLAPSGAGIWSQCAGSPLMCTTVPPQEETEETRAGEASHYALERMFAGDLPDDLIGSEAPNGVIMDSEMVTCAQVCFDDVNNSPPMTEVHVEEKLHIPCIHTECYGTPDFWGLAPNYIYLWDYKFGHRDVPADSWQNICYVAGVLDHLHANGLDDQNLNVVMTIVQPRSYSSEGPVKRWQGKASDLRAPINILMAQAAKAYEIDPGVQSGNHCRDCEARHICPAARHAAATAVDYAGSAMPETLTVEALSFELSLLERATKAIKYRYDAIQTTALSMIADQGAVIPGYGLKNGSGQRKFEGTTDELIMLGDMLGIDMRAPTSVITPAEFDRRLAEVNKQRKENNQELVDKSVISSYVVKPSTGIKLVPIEETLAVKAFNQKGSI